MKVLLHPTYFPDIATFSTLAQRDVVWEVHDNYQKQTYRNRCYISTDQGKLMLNIPIKHVGGKQGRQKYRDVRIENEYPWQRQHLKTLQTAYRTSPYFEFYEDEFIPIFERNFKFLLDMNLEIIALLCDILGMEFYSDKSESYRIEPKESFDGRFLVHAKQEIDFEQVPYPQVFDDRHDFVKNASILDLLFNEGTNALEYLRRQSLSFLNV